MRLPSEKARIKKEEQSEATSNETYRRRERSRPRFSRRMRIRKES